MNTESRIERLIAAGDLRGATTEAIRSFGPDVLRYLRSLLRDEDVAADAFSQFAEALWKGLPSFRADSSLRTWALRIATNVAANVRGEAWRRRVRRLATGEASAIAAQVRSSVIRVEQEEAGFERLRACLSLRDQSLLALRIDQQLSWNEIADVLSRRGEPSTVAGLCKRFERLKRRLAEMAREEGLLD